MYQIFSTFLLRFTPGSKIWKSVAKFENHVGRQPTRKEDVLAYTKFSQDSL